MPHCSLTEYRVETSDLDGERGLRPSMSGDLFVDPLGVPAAQLGGQTAEHLAVSRHSRELGGTRLGANRALQTGGVRAVFLELREHCGVRLDTPRRPAALRLEEHRVAEGDAVVRAHVDDDAAKPPPEDVSIEQEVLPQLRRVPKLGEEILGAWLDDCPCVRATSLLHL